MKLKDRFQEIVSSAMATYQCNRDAVPFYAGAALMMPHLAQAQGLVKLFTNFSTLGNAVISTCIVLGGVAGVGAYLRAGYLLTKKGGDRGDDIEWKQIGYTLAGGTVGFIIAVIATMSVETVGGSAADIGRGIKINPN